MLQPVLQTRKARCPLIGQKLQFRKWTSSNGKWTTTKRIHGRIFFHGKRGELRQRYREGQDDQLGALGLVVDMIVLWNTLYMQAAIDQLRAEGYPSLTRTLRT
jgi:ribosomal protein L35AE/L33A